MEQFISDSAYPEMQNYDNNLDFHMAFDQSIISIAYKIMREQQKNPRKMMKIHCFLEAPNVMAVYRVIGFVDSPTLLILEIPEEEEFKFYTPEGRNFFTNLEDFPEMKLLPNETIRKGKKYIYFGSYQDRFHQVFMQDLPNKNMTERLSVLDS